jgi:hypothetical protein
VLGQARAVPAAYAMSGPDQYRYIHFVAHGTASRTPRGTGSRKRSARHQRSRGLERPGVRRIHPHDLPDIAIGVLDAAAEHEGMVRLPFSVISRLLIG